MVRTNLRGVFATYKKLNDGSTRAYWYHRATGKRLHGSPGSSEFIVDLAAAENFTNPIHKGSFSGLVRDYIQSIEFEQLANSTADQYKRMLGKAESNFGDLPIDALNDLRVRGDFLDWRERIAKSSGFREADHRLSAISSMISWAVNRGRLTANPIKGFRRLHHADRSEKIWLPEHIERFMNVASVEMQRAMILALHTGHRQGDLLRLPWSAYENGAITLRQSKAAKKGVKGKSVSVKCTATLRGMLDSMDRRSPLVLTTKTGGAFKKRYFARRWKEATVQAGIDDLKFHDLRGTAITMLSEAGNTVQQIASVTGHSLRTVHTILEKYLARTRHLSDDAIDNFENSSRTKFANQLQTVTRPKASRTK